MAIPKVVKQSIATALGHEIRRRRKDHGLLQSDLAEQAGLHETYVSRVERGKSVPSLDVVFALCDALEVEVGPLMTKVKRLAEEYEEEAK